MYVRKVFCELLSNNLEFNFEPTCSIFFWTSFDGSISSEHLYSVTRYYLVNKMLLFTKIFQPRLVLSLSITFVDFYYKHQKGYKINKMTNQSWPPSQNFKNLDGRFQNQIKHQPSNFLRKTVKNSAKITISDTQLGSLKKTLKFEWNHKTLPTFIMLDLLKSHFTISFVFEKSSLVFKSQSLAGMFYKSFMNTFLFLWNPLWTPFFFPYFDFSYNIIRD